MYIEIVKVINKKRIILATLHLKIQYPDYVYGMWLWRKNDKYVEMLQIDYGVQLMVQEEIKRIFSIERWNHTLPVAERQFSKE